MENPIEYNGNQKYTLIGDDSCWITIDDMVLYARKIARSDQDGMVIIEFSVDDVESPIETMSFPFPKGIQKESGIQTKQLFTNGVLDHVEENDFVFQPGEDDFWLDIETLSLHIKRVDDGVSLDVFPINSKEDKDLIARQTVDFDFDQEIGMGL
jgi:hypothetical protein